MAAIGAAAAGRKDAPSNGGGHAAAAVGTLCRVGGETGGQCRWRTCQADTATELLVGDVAKILARPRNTACLLYTSDAADE